MQVLMAEDDPMARKVLERYLQQWGYEYRVAQDGEEAWTLFQQGDYQIVITDWMMPKLDGVGLIRNIRNCENTDHVYALLLSARSQKEDLVEGMDAGADDFVAKPFDRDELRVRLREGERIVRLGRELSAQKLAANSLAAGIVPGIRQPLDELADNLTDMRREISAVRNAINRYRETCQKVTVAQPDVRAELTQLEEQLDGISLDGLLDKTVNILEQVRDILRQLESAGGKEEATDLH
jgi:DNA-binding response OmpR family regulator